MRIVIVLSKSDGDCCHIWDVWWEMLSGTPAAGEMYELATATYLPEAMQSHQSQAYRHLVRLGERKPRSSEAGGLEDE